MQRMQRIPQLLARLEDNALRVNSHHRATNCNESVAIPDLSCLARSLHISATIGSIKTRSKTCLTPGLGRILYRSPDVSGSASLSGTATAPFTPTTVIL